VGPAFTANDVMEHARRDDRVRIVAAAQQLRDLERVQDERRLVGLAPLTGVTGRREFAEHAE
jgi:hypothetical protein